MSMTIDQVIERSRERGEFSERKRFTVARSRAIQKMRQFALADPSYYVLEWIQAAVANGATYLDLSIDEEEVRMSYVGGGFTRSELEALFDFLFASKDDLAVADARQLALGVNALLSATIERIVIESGDGTLEGTTRVEINGKSDEVFVGTPLHALEGTFVRASGLHRRSGTIKELRAIEERCLTATIPILVNDVPIFGYAAIRSPDLFGYRRTLKFDEGDLYGTIGLATTPITRNFKLLTWGTWINTTRHEFEGLPAMGGVIGYDRLRKTADHAGIVQDEVYQEMWARLASYARQLASGHTGKATFEVRLLDGPPVSAQQFRNMVREHGRAVVFDIDKVSSDEHHDLAARYGNALDAPVFLVGERDHDTVRHLGGPEVVIHSPTLDERELTFFELPVAPDPPRPWLTGALEVPGLQAEDLANRLANEFDGNALARSASALVREASGITAKVFTPAAPTRDVELWVEIRVTGRLAWSGNIPTAYPGHHLVINLDEVSVAALSRKVDGITLGELVASVIAAYAQPVLVQASQRVIDSLRPSEAKVGTASRIALGALSRAAIKRLRRGPDGISVRFALDDPALPDALLDVPLFKTIVGTELSLHGIEQLLRHTCGLVYGALPDQTIDPGLDGSRILVLDRPEEGMLQTLVGSQSYVRICDPTTYAQAGPASCCAFTPGLRRYPDCPLLVEGTAPADAADLNSLLEQLWALRRTKRSSTDVLRHLIFFVVNGGDAVPPELRAAPLFRGADGRALSYSEILPELLGKGVRMYDGWSADSTWDAEGSDARPATVALAMNPFVFHVLSARGTVRPILDVDLNLAEARRDPTTAGVAFLEAEAMSSGLEGTIGFPMRALDEPVVLLLNRRQGTAVALRKVGRDYGVAGRIRAISQLDPAEAEQRCVVVALDLYGRLIRRLPSLDTSSDGYLRALEVLLGYAGRRVRITQNPDRSLGVTCVDATARRILDLPVFPTTAGVAVTPMRMLREFAIFGDRKPRSGRPELIPEAPEVLRRWLDEALDPERVAEHPHPAPELRPRTNLEHWLTAMLAALRTDTENATVQLRLVPRQNFIQWTPQFGVEPSEEMIVSNDIVYIDASCWLARDLLDENGEPIPERASWLLLAVYARVNELRLSVTNVHEMHFQSRVLDWLSR